MKKILLLLLVAASVANKPCLASDHSDDLLSIIRLTTTNATQEHVTGVLGRPEAIKENSKRSWWHYTTDKTNIVICWNKKSDLLEKFSITTKQQDKLIFDKNTYRQLKSGATDIAQAIQLLGTPTDITVKKATQEMHYTYQKSMLRLFFRDRVLVDYTLLSQK